MAIFRPLRFWKPVHGRPSTMSFRIDRLTVDLPPMLLPRSPTMRMPTPRATALKKAGEMAWLPKSS